MWIVASGGITPIGPRDSKRRVDAVLAAELLDEPLERLLEAEVVEDHRVEQARLHADLVERLLRDAAHLLEVGDHAASRAAGCVSRGRAACRRP